MGGGTRWAQSSVSNSRPHNNVPMHPGNCGTYMYIVALVYNIDGRYIYREKERIKNNFKFNP